MASLLEEIENGTYGTIPEIISKPKRIEKRRYNVECYRLSGETQLFEDVSIQAARRIKKREIKLGWYSNIIEVTTKVNEPVGKEFVKRTLTFDQQTFDPAKEKAIPAPIEPIIPEATQNTIPWEVIDKKPDTWLDNRPIVKVADRNAKNKAAQKRSALVNKENEKNAEVSDSNKVMIFSKGNDLLYNGDSVGAAAYIIKNNVSLKEVIVYVNSAIYERLVTE